MRIYREAHSKRLQSILALPNVSRKLGLRLHKLLHKLGIMFHFRQDLRIAQDITSLTFSSRYRKHECA